jgi:hypothetical protein
LRGGGVKFYGDVEIVAKHSVNLPFKCVLLGV